MKIDKSRLNPDRLFADQNVIDGDDTLEYHGIISPENINETPIENLGQYLDEVEAFDDIANPRETQQSIDFFWSGFDKEKKREKRKGTRLILMI